MKHILEIQGFLLRETNEEDAEFFYELNSDPDVIKFTGNDAFTSIEEARKMLRNYQDYKKNGYGRWAVVEKATTEIWGWCGLKLRENGEIHLGYRFHKRYWNKEAATECSITCIQYGFENLGLPRIMAEALIEHKASERVMQKAGMNFCRNDQDHDGETIMYEVKLNA